jgi:hypothetical protein
VKIADLEPRGAAVSDEELRAVLSTGFGAGRGSVTIIGLSEVPTPLDQAARRWKRT